MLFDIGSGRYAAPPLESSAEVIAQWERDLAEVRKEADRASKALSAAEAGDRSHTEVQGWLRDLGLALGYGVWVASNDRNRSYAGGRLADGCLEALPAELENGSASETVRLIDVLWIEPSAGHAVAAFEVEHTTSIYSGIVRMLDLALGVPDPTASALFLVAPDQREDEVRTQLMRPAFRSVSHLRVRFLPYSELGKHREAIARFGSGMKAIEAIARELV